MGQFNLISKAITQVSIKRDEIYTEQNKNLLE